MANLQLDIVMRNNRTHTKGYLARDLVTFNNKGGETLVVTIESQGPQKALCKSNDLPVESPFNVPANKSKTLKICSAYTADEFKYTAQIGNSIPEDPIIIISRSFAPPPGLVIAVVVGLVSLAVGILVGRLSVKRRVVA